MSEYAFQGHVYGQNKYWADNYQRLGDARRAAKSWVSDHPSRTASLLQRQPMQGGHAIGATWKEVGHVQSANYLHHPSRQA